MTHDHDTRTPSLDGPSSLSFRRPSTPPDLPSPVDLEPIGTCHVTITASTFDGSESAVIVDRADFPAWPDAAQGAPSASDDERLGPGDETAPVTLVARACGHCGRDITKRRKGCLYCTGACRVAVHRDPARGDVVAKAERRERKATPAQYEREEGRR